MYKISCVLFVNKDNLNTKYELIAELFEAKAIYSDDITLIGNLYRGLEIQEISKFNDSDWDKESYLIATNHPHSFAKKNGLNPKRVLTTKNLRSLIINYLNEAKTPNLLLTRDYFDYFYLNSSVNSIDPKHDKISLSDCSLCKLKLRNSNKYIFTFFFPLLWLFLKTYFKLLMKKISKQQLAQSPQTHKTLLIWNMCDVFFLDQIVSNTNFDNYKIRLIDDLSRLSFPRAILHYSKLMNLEVSSYDPTFTKLTKAFTYYQSTFSKGLAKQISATNCEDRLIENDKIINAIFLGFCTQQRAQKVLRVKTLLNQLNQNCSIKFLNEGKQPLSAEQQKYVIKASLGYHDYLKCIPKIDIIIEIMRAHHQGMTLRTMEALFFQKKLITDNLEIKNMDFYSPNNIFLIGYDEDSKLAEFITSPLDKEKLSPHIIEKYTTEYLLQKLFNL